MDKMITGYLYRHIRKDTNEVFYIGITCNSNYKRAYSKIGRNSFWKNIVQKTDYEVEIMIESEDYDFLQEKEKEFISLYGRKDLNKGSLVNLTDGGHSFKGYVWTQEYRDRISKSRMGRPGMKGEKHPMFGKRGVLSPFFGIPKSEEDKRKNSESQKGSKNHFYGKKRPGHGDKISLALKGTKRPELSIKFTGKSNPFYGKKHTDKSKELKGKKVIDLKTGIIYISMFDASEKLNINYFNLKYWIRNKKTEKTSLVLLEEYNANKS